MSRPRDDAFAEGKWLCNLKGCHTVYEAREVIDPSNDYRLWVDD